jgi:hypothetical protein
VVLLVVGLWLAHALTASQQDAGLPDVGPHQLQRDRNAVSVSRNASIGAIA